MSMEGCKMTKLYYGWSGTQRDTEHLLAAISSDLPEDIQKLPKKQFLALFQASLARNVVIN